MQMSHSGTTLKFPSWQKSGSRVQNHSRIAISTSSLFWNRRPPTFRQRPKRQSDGDAGTTGWLASLCSLSKQLHLGIGLLLRPTRAATYIQALPTNSITQASQCVAEGIRAELAPRNMNPTASQNRQTATCPTESLFKFLDSVSPLWLVCEMVYSKWHSRRSGMLRSVDYLLPTFQANLSVPPSNVKQSTSRRVALRSPATVYFVFELLSM
jgi:hypothetical protein